MNNAEEERQEHLEVPELRGKRGNEALTDKQLLAIDLLTTGTRPQDVAQQVGISREQLWRWRTKNPNFIAAMEHRRIEIHQAIVDRFWGGLVPDAIQVAAESLAEGDPDMAGVILRLAARGLTDLRASDD